MGNEAGEYFAGKTLSQHTEARARIEAVYRNIRVEVISKEVHWPEEREGESDQLLKAESGDAER